MSLTLKQITPVRKQKQLSKEVTPELISWGGTGGMSRIKFSDGGSAPGSCIRCTTPSCLRFSDNELSINSSGWKSFPSDMNSSVCPTTALTWAQENDSPSVNTDDCILCGLCVSRCPVRAINLRQDGAHVNDEENTYFSICETAESSEKELLSLFDNLDEEGSYLTETDEVMGVFREKFEEVTGEQDSQFPNLLARNLLLATGLNTAIRRRGDSNVRMDLAFCSSDEIIGVGEVEFGNGVLDSPRNIVDNVAVLNPKIRHGF